MRILISGSTGLIGRALVGRLLAEGHLAVRLARAGTSPHTDAVVWNPDSGRIEQGALAGFDAVVHLAGKNLASVRWNERRMREFYDSRVVATRNLCRALADCERPPGVLLCASATGYYGDGGDAELTESSEMGEGYLARLCHDWEAACEPARDAGIRVVNLRFGIVLDRDGGALAKMLVPFRLGLGGRLGDGRPYMSWITMEDTVGAMLHMLQRDSISGPVNVVAPHPVTNREFTATLARVLRRPAVIPVPAVMLRALVGRMADEALLVSQRVVPQRLQSSGFVFRSPHLEDALRQVLSAEG